MKVLGPFVVAGEDVTARGRAVAAWAGVEGLWQRRAGVVAFVNHAARTPEIFDGFTDLLVESCATIVGDERRWAQTGVGWFLRELSRREPQRVRQFVVEHPELSKEARTHATKYSGVR